MSRRESLGCVCLQLAFLGAEGTGKASLIHQVLGNGYIEHRKPDIDDFKNKTISIPGTPNIVIMDTSDLHNFPPMKRVTIQRASIFVLVFSLDNKKTFVEVERYYDDIVELKKSSSDYTNNRIPIVVVGNKSEVPRHEQFDKNDVVNKVIDQWDCKYIETSARTGENIKQLTEMIIDEVRLSYGIETMTKKKTQSLTKKLKSIFT